MALGAAREGGLEVGEEAGDELVGALDVGEVEEEGTAQGAGKARV